MLISNVSAISDGWYSKYTKSHKLYAIRLLSPKTTCSTKTMKGIQHQCTQHRSTAKMQMCLLNPKAPPKSKWFCFHCKPQVPQGFPESCRLPRRKEANEVTFVKVMDTPQGSTHVHLGEALPPEPNYPKTNVLGETLLQLQKNTAKAPTLCTANSMRSG